MDKSKVILIEDRIPKLKQQRRKKANRRLIIFLLLFFLLILGILYFQSPLSHVGSIEVKGNLIHSTDEIIEQSGLSKDTNIWKIDKDGIVDKVTKLPEIKSAKVTTIFPNKVEITVEEWKRIAYMLKETTFLPILENGQILQQESFEIPIDSPILFYFEEGEILQELINGLNKIPTEVLNSISEIHSTPKEKDIYHITMFMNDGFEVSASIRNFAEKMSLYPSFVSQLDPNRKGVIDLEVGSFFRAYDAEFIEGEGENEEEE